MTTFYNFALIIETRWAKKVVMPILETGNAATMLPMMLLCMFGLFIPWWKNMQYKKE